MMFYSAVCIAMFGPLNWNGPRVFTLTGRRDRHTYSIRFEQQNFNWKRRHLVKVLAPGTTDQFYPGFVDRGKPRMFYISDRWSRSELTEWVRWMTRPKLTEVRSVTVTVDGRRWPVPRRLYFDLLDPDFGSIYEFARLSRSGQQIMFDMAGSDGGGSYRATWLLRRHGPPKRKMVQYDEDQSPRPHF